MSFVDRDRPTGGLNVGNLAPDFRIPATAGEDGVRRLSDLRGHYVLVSFWAGYDAPSRMANVALSNALRRADGGQQQIEMVSVSFDEYRSVFEETVREDGIQAVACFQEAKGADSRIYGKYRLERGFTTYLLDERGVIVAHGLTPAELAEYID